MRRPAELAELGMEAQVPREVARGGDPYGWLLDKGIAESSLYAFLKQSWPNFDPSAFIDGWHLRAIADHLEAVNNGEIRRLLINIPPRHCKTLLTAVAWPVWTWVQQGDAGYPLKGPGVRFLCASYGADKAQQDAVTARRLIASPWFQQRWGSRVVISKDRDNQGQYDNLAGGSRISTGIPESLGKGGIIKIIDDPHKTQEVESKDVIASQIRAYDEVWETRSNDPQRGAEVIIMQRLGETDLSAHLLRKDTGLVHLMLPAEFETDRRCSTAIGFTDYRESDGELLWPQRFDRAWAQRTKSADQGVGDYAWAGQYQQRPNQRGGGILKRDWWQPYGPWRDGRGEVRLTATPTTDWSEMLDPVECGLKFPSFSYVLASLDTAFTEEKANDPSALLVLGVWSDPDTGYQQVMLVYAWQRWLTLNELAIQVDMTCDKYRVDKLLIENKASGHSLMQEMHRLFAAKDYAVQFTDPTRKGEKEARANSITPIFQERMIHRPNTDWGQMVEDQAALFPRDMHDDLVDALVQGVRFLRDTGLLSRKVEQRRREAALEEYRGKSAEKPLYAT